MAKRNILEVFKEINDEDINNNTANLMVGYNATNVTKCRQGTKITMGIGGDHVEKIVSEEYMPILILVHKETFFEKHNQEV